MKDIILKAKEMGIPIIRTESYNVLIDITKSTNPKHILEIGTAVGYSGIAMLKNSTASLVSIEHDKHMVTEARRNFKKSKLSKRAKVVFGDAPVEIAKMVASKNFDDYFDMIFLDGPKAQYDSMLENLLILLKPNGTLLADNVLFHGYVDGKTSMPTKRYKTIVKRLNDFIDNCKTNKKLKDFKLISVEDGLVFAKKVCDEK